MAEYITETAFVEEMALHSDNLVFKNVNLNQAFIVEFKRYLDNGDIKVTNIITNGKKYKSGYFAGRSILKNIERIIKEQNATVIQSERIERN